MLEFTKALYELFIRQGLTLTQSLLIMRAKPRKDRVSRAAASIYAALENGSLFSNALKVCKDCSFDPVYISFISIAEKNGDLKSTLSFLKQKLEREAECRKKIEGALVYPIFVVTVSVAATIFIGLYTKTADFQVLMKYVLGLFTVCMFLIFVIIKMLGESRLFEAFTAVDFLLRNGIELSVAVGCAIQIAGPSSRIGKFFENARIKLLYGMNLQNAFLPSDEYKGFYNSKLQEAFYYADTGGSKEDLFRKIAGYLEEEKERSRNICISLIEPLFIVITGGFILVLLMTFFMPLINNIAFM